MKPFLVPLRPFLVLGLAVSLFPTLALAQLFYPNVRYRVRSVPAADTVLDVKGGPAAVGNGVRTPLYRWWGGKHQSWFIEKQPDGTYVIRSVSSGYRSPYKIISVQSNKVLDARDGMNATEMVPKLQQWDCNSLERRVESGSLGK